MKVNIRPLKKARIEMLPLIDIVFLVLVFFIYAMLSMAVHRGQKVDLPLSRTVSVEKNSAVAVTIQAVENGIALFVDKQPVSLDGLAQALRAGCGEHQPAPESEIQLFADKTVAYQDLFSVMDRIKEAGFAGISLQAEVKGP